MEHPQPTLLPTGTVTFLFSDVEDSTGLLQRQTDRFKHLIERHAAIIRECLDTHNGIEIRTEGDSFFAVFENAPDAVAAATAIQSSISAEAWPDGGVVKVRIGLHTGIGELGFDDYVGIDVHRAARISAAGHGGQTVVSEAVQALATGSPFTDLGEHVLRGLERPERIYQLDVPGLPRVFPPLRTASVPPNNLPTLASHLVGRDSERTTVQELVDTNRLVTVTGPGGIGKTRLALKVAEDLLGRFERGVFFVDLTPIDDPELLLTAITAASGVQPGKEADLATALSDGPRLLVLDNFEQLAPAAPRLAELLSAAPPLKVLTTSQVPLRVSGEVVMRLEPLPVSGDDSPAVRLFVERARQVEASFDPGAHRDAVLQLVDALDGVPLAIELAAARVNVLTPGEIMDRLGEGILKTTRSDSPERHRSIQAAVEWSYSLLTADQRELLQALSVFRGGATLGAAEAVVGRDVLDDLSELIDRSLVEAESGTVGKRFELLTSIQLYGAAQIPEGAPFAERHVDHFGRLAVDARQPLDGPDAHRWLAKLADEVDNLRAALDRLLASGGIQRGLEMLGGSWRFFQLTGRLDELELWLNRFFDADLSREPTMATTRAVMARGALHYWRNEWQQANDDYEVALTHADATEDPELIGDVLVGLLATRANAYALGPSVGDVQMPLERLRRHSEETRDPLQLAYADFYEGITATADGRTDGPPPLERLERIAQQFLTAGRLMNVAHLRSASSEILIAQEDYRAAQRAALDGLNTAEKAGDVFTMSWALYRLATTIIELGQPELGVRIAGAADATRQRSGGRLPPPFMPISEPLDRARSVIGDAADALYVEGRELGLVAAMELAREAAG